MTQFCFKKALNRPILHQLEAAWLHTETLRLSAVSQVTYASSGDGDHHLPASYRDSQPGLAAPLKGFPACTGEKPDHLLPGSGDGVQSIWMMEAFVDGTVEAGRRARSEVKVAGRSKRGETKQTNGKSGAGIARRWSKAVYEHIRKGRLEAAEDAVRRMVLEGVEPTRYTYAPLIVAWTARGSLTKVQEWFARARASGEANIVVWNAFIAALCKLGCLDEAEETIKSMVEAGLRPDERTYTSVIVANCDSGHLKAAGQWSETMRKAGFLPSTAVYTAFIRSYCKKGDMQSAEEVVRKMNDVSLPLSNYTFHAILGGWANLRQLHQAREVLRRMAACRVAADERTYAIFVSACRTAEDFESVEQELEGLESAVWQSERVFTSLAFTAFRLDLFVRGEHWLNEMVRAGTPLTLTVCKGVHKMYWTKNMLEDAQRWAHLIEGLAKPSSNDRTTS